MSSSPAYLLYGLCVRSALPLTAPLASADVAPDFCVAWGEELPPNPAPPAGETWAHADFGNGQVVQLTRTAAGWSIFYHRAGEFRLAADLRSATAHALPGQAQTLPLLLAGGVVSWLLNLRGEPVLHASAVAVGDDAVAFLGASGMGKSTLATLLCSAGAHLVTDDVDRKSVV